MSAVMTPLDIVRQLRAQERCASCGYLASAPGHRLCCGSPPAPAPWKPVSRRLGSLTPAQIVRQLRPQLAARSDLSVCGPCWDDLCIACQGGRCICACQDERRPA